MVLFKNVISALFMRFFDKKEKFLNVGKIRKYDEESVFFSRKQRSHLLKLHLYQIGRVQNNPMVAPRVVIERVRIFVQRKLSSKIYHENK